MNHQSKDASSGTSADATEIKSQNAENQRLRSSGKAVLSLEDNTTISIACEEGLKCGSPANSEVEQASKRCQYKTTICVCGSPTAIEKKFRMRETGQFSSSAEIGMRTPEEQRAHRAEIADILEQATRVALEIGTIQPMNPDPPAPGVHRRYMRRNSFVDRRPFLGLSSEQPLGDSAAPAVKRLRYSSIKVPLNHRLGALGEEGTLMGLSRDESEMLFRRMSLPWSANSENKQEL